MLTTMLVFAGCDNSGGTNEKVEFRSDEANNKIEVYTNGELFTNFYYPGDIEKPALYPVYTLSGKDITRGYPYNPKPFERSDHPHHVGLWLNFGDVNGLDFWNNSFAVSPENKHRYGSIRFREIISQDQGSGELVVGSDWVDNDNNILLNEETTFVFNENDGIRSIKRTSTLTAVQDVRFQGNKEGLLGLRVDRAFEESASGPQRLLDIGGEMSDDELNQIHENFNH